MVVGVKEAKAPLDKEPWFHLFPFRGRIIYKAYNETPTERNHHEEHQLDQEVRLEAQGRFCSNINSSIADDCEQNRPEAARQLPERTWSV